jgi:hypothetical protein
MIAYSACEVRETHGAENYARISGVITDEWKTRHMARQREPEKSDSLFAGGIDQAQFRR